jgi:peptide methionine sulfoxide reductase MsrA
MENLQKSGRYKNPISTEIAPASQFYRAEDYHQQYVAKRERARHTKAG